MFTTVKINHFSCVMKSNQIIARYFSITDFHNYIEFSGANCNFGDFLQYTLS